MATKELGFEEIKRGILAGNFAPVYLFQGDESYFIDRLTDMLIENVLDDSERDFNQIIFYGLETNARTVIASCKRFPMMAERQLVVLKEAQNMKDIEELAHYVKQPLQSTVLVINYKHGKLDGRKKLAAEIGKTGLAFESKKLYENRMPDFIIRYLQEKNVKIEQKASLLLTDYLGNDLSKLTNELEKLIISLPQANAQITPELIEKNIGVSKDYNNFELQKAIASKDVLKANRIVKYFEQNPKNNPLIVTLTVLFNFFANLMICHYERNKTETHLMSALGFRYNFQITDYMQAMKNYPPAKTMQIISLIRTADAQSKGVDNVSLPDGKLLAELLYRIMH
ncbi:MAG: DNA polymerase III subunit delta [Dysgonamonadaceae bacterium]|jgi:DNA polymerase-3 subunit delta|nr:DNA polymerase III subunit delta [Dysgonamonadaceae bacterium]